MKKILLTLSLLSSVVTSFAGNFILGDDEQLAIEALNHTYICAPESMGPLVFLYRDKKYSIVKDGIEHEVQNCYVDKVLRGISDEALANFFDANCYIQIGQLESDGDTPEFTIHAKSRVVGGGFWGAVAGAWLGKIVVVGLSQAGIGVISLGAGMIGGPIAAAATWKTLEIVLAPTIIAASTSVALATGIAGAVVTGPV